MAARRLPYLPTTALPIAAIAATAAALVGVLLAVRPLAGLGLLGALVYTPLTLVNLPLGFALYVPLVFVEHLPASYIVPEAAGLLLLLTWLGALGDRRAAVAATLRRHRALLALAAALLAWLVLSAVWAEDAGQVAGDIGQWGAAVAIFLLTATALGTPGRVRLIAGAFVAGAVISTAIGAFDDTLVSGSSAVEQASEAEGRLQGGGGDPNYQAAGLVPAAALAGGLAAVSRGLLARLGLAVVVAGLALGLAATQSRGALVAAGVTAVAALIAFRRRGPVLLVVALVALGAATWFALFPDALDRIVSSDASGGGRADLWRVAWLVFLDHPFLGVGLDNFQLEAAEHVRSAGALTAAEQLAERPEVVHNVFLQLLAENGILGLALFIALCAACLAAARRAAWLLESVGERALGTLSRAAMVAMVAALSASLFLSNATDKRTWVLLGLGPALLALAERRAGVSDRPL